MLINQQTEQKVYQSMDNKKQLQSRKVELSTPGLQDQCSNHWADEVHTSAFKIVRTKK